MTSPDVTKVEPVVPTRPITPRIAVPDPLAKVDPSLRLPAADREERDE